MRRIHLAWALAAAWGALVAAAPANESDASTKETRAMMHAYAKCVVKRQGAKASEALLADIDNSEILRRYRMLVIGDCLARQVVSTTRMRFGGDLYRYALADALVNAEFANKPPIDVELLPRLEQRKAGEPPRETGPDGKKLSKRKYQEALDDYHQSVGYSFLANYGECIVRLNAPAAHALLLTEPDSTEESARFAALKPALANCLPEGQTLRFGKVSLRGSIAVNYYRLAHSSPAAGRAAG
jgi:hypothetical protein